MKKNINIILLTALALLALSCSKDLSEEMTLFTNFHTVAVKTHFGAETDGKIPVCWEADDMIWVCSNTMSENWAKGAAFTTNADAISEDGKSAVFKGVYRKDGGRMVAVYPYEIVCENARYDNLILEIPQVQEYNPTNCAKHSCIAVSYWTQGDKISFSYLVGCLKLSLKGSGQTVKKMVVMDNDPTHQLWGRCEVRPNEEGDAVGQAILSTGDNSLTIDCKTPVILGSTPSDFHLMVPGGSFASGMTITLYDGDGKLVKAFNTYKDNTVNAGKFLKMPEIDIDVME